VTPAVPPSLSAIGGSLDITNGRAKQPAIGSPANAGAAVQTTGSKKIRLGLLFDRSPGRLGRELRPASAGRGFQSMPAASLSASASNLRSPGLLSSVVAFDGVFLTFIILKKTLMSRLSNNHLLDFNKPRIITSGHISQGRSET
jgi:hypothetical protein